MNVLYPADNDKSKHTGGQSQPVPSDPMQQLQDAVGANGHNGHQPARLDDVFPQELQRLPQFVRYTLVPKPSQPGKFDKIPYDPRHPALASTTDSKTWGTLHEALAGCERFGGDGPGFAFSKDDPYNGVDLDGCRDPQTGVITPQTWEYLRLLNSYTEVSPSGRGVHVIGRGPERTGWHKHPYDGGAIEIYSQGRFFTVTGQHVEGTPTTVNDISEALATITADLWAGREFALDSGPQPDTNGRYAKPSYGATGLSDADVLDHCRSDRTGWLFSAFYDRADLSEVDDDDSRADWFVWNKLVFYLGDDVERIRALAEAGAHYLHPGDQNKANDRRAKWQRKDAAYGTLQRATVAKILASRTANEIYQGGEALNLGLDHHVLVDKTLARLALANNPANGEPTLYVRSGVLVRVHTDERHRPNIQPIGEDGLKVEIARVVRYTRTLASGQRVRAKPPTDVVRGVLAAPEYTLPPLAGITEVPVLRPDGTILDTPGYDVATRLVYRPAPDIATIPPVSANPTNEELRAAWHTLHYVFVDFPFQSPADRANLMGLLVSTALRPAIAGPIPLALVDAPTGGTGKGLLTDVVALTATGATAEMLQATDNEEEWRKRITSALISGRAFTCIDNVEARIESSALASLLTAEGYKDRLLGTNREVVIPMEQVGVWSATGNNISVGGTLPRRSYRIRLDAQMPNPYLRPTNDFREPRLRDYVRDHRAELLHALLTVCRAWFARGRPTHGAPTLGSFERWAETVWGVLSLDPTRVDPHGSDPRCFGSYFLATGNDLWAQGDGDAEEWEAFLMALAEEVGGRQAGPVSQPFTLAQVAEVVRRGPPFYEPLAPTLREALPESLLGLADSQKLAQQLGYAFRKRRGTRYGDAMWRIDTAENDKHNKVMRWVVRYG